MGRIIIIVLAVILILIVFLLTSWVRITLVYERSLKIYIRFLFIRFSPWYIKNKKIYLRDYSVKALRKKRILFQKSKKNIPKKPEIKKDKMPSDKAGVSNLRNLLRYLLRITLVLIKRYNKCLRVDIKRFVITVATGDAAQTAIVYGAVSQATAALLSLFGRYYKIKYTRGAQTGVQADFLNDNWSADLHIVFRARLYHFISLALRAFIEYSKR
ncbi:MAG: DUF2953 domain-containing protein [Eubacteriales bacterium]